MSSPAKKRRLNNGGKTAAGQPRGLEYFFSRKRQNDGASAPDSGAETPPGNPGVLTDEELARKLQAQYDKEVASETGVEVRGGGATKDEGGMESDGQDGALPLESKAKADGAVIARPEARPDMPETTLTLQSAAKADDGIIASIPLDESPLKFDPSKYVPQLQQHWAAEGGNAPYTLLTRCFVLVSATSSRIKIVDTLVNCLRILIEGDAPSLLPAVSSPWVTMARR